MKNILSSLNESEKKRILEMHYKASNRHYLNEAVNADYNVIKTSMDATYGVTMKTYLMSTVTLQGQDDTGKPTQIKFNPTNPLGTIKRKSKTTGTDYDVDVLDPVYSCADGVFLERSDSVFEYQKAYASSIGATEQTAASAARGTWETELKKIGAAGCKAIDAVSKGLPNPLAPKVAASNTPQEKKSLPATKGVGGTISQELLSPNVQSIITAQELQGVGLRADDGPRVSDVSVNKTDGGMIYGPGDSIFFCSSNNGKPAYTFSYTDPKLESAFAAYKPQIVALWKKQCAHNVKWAQAANYRTKKLD
jgi:hypothetical protein